MPSIVKYMAEELHISSSLTKAETYQALLPKIKALVTGEPSIIANLANISAALKSTFNWWWVGFYLVEKNELVLGPFQGPIACTRIGLGRGVCGVAWQNSATIIVDDVDNFVEMIKDTFVHPNISFTDIIYSYDTRQFFQLI